MNAVSPPNSLQAESGLTYLPIFVGLTGRTALLIGGGDATLAKLALLRRAGARVRLIAPHLDETVRRFVLDERMVSWISDPLAGHHFSDAVLAIDASGDDQTNRLSVHLARAARVPINVVDRPALCAFILPAILDRSPVIVAVSTGGLAPAIARLIRQRLETAIPVGFGRVAMLAARLRHAVRKRLHSVAQRMRFWEDLFDGPAASLAMAGRMDGALAAAQALMERSAGQLQPAGGDVRLLHITSDDPDLLTVRDARLIRMADVIFHDPEIGGAILDLARRDAIKIKMPPSTSPSRPGDHARCGRLVLHLTAAAPPSAWLASQQKTT